VREEGRQRRDGRATRAITIRDLLTHTAGISYGTEEAVAASYEAKGWAGRGFGCTPRTRTSQSATRWTARIAALRGAAGEAWVYGYNSDILGCVVERASGMPLDQFIASRITGPLA